MVFVESRPRHLDCRVSGTHAMALARTVDTVAVDMAERSRLQAISAGGATAVGLTVELPVQGRVAEEEEVAATLAMRGVRTLLEEGHCSSSQPLRPQDLAGVI